jgi:thiamine kinase-like enzyme
LASEACLSADHIFSQINQRFQQLSLVKNQELQNFLNTTFKPLWDAVHNWSEQHWPERSLVNDLPKTMQVFSPSDFGFHNALLKKNGEICFLDFEYFGRDDPVKLMADFIWHPGMNLDFSHKAEWLKETFRIFSKDPDLYSRFHAAWPLYGLRWSLILLNEFREDGWHKRVYANTDLECNHEKKLYEQLVKATSVCKQIQETNMKCPYV